jgi:hypothetical protein
VFSNVLLDALQCGAPIITIKMKTSVTIRNELLVPMLEKSIGKETRFWKSLVTYFYADVKLVKPIK